jgi:hypothetical protein
MDHLTLENGGTTFLWNVRKQPIMQHRMTEDRTPQLQCSKNLQTHGRGILNVFSASYGLHSSDKVDWNRQ